LEKEKKGKKILLKTLCPVLLTERKKGGGGKKGLNAESEGGRKGVFFSLAMYRKGGGGEGVFAFSSI